MSDRTFVLVCLAGVFGLILTVGGVLSLLMLHSGRAKAWKNKAALAKAMGQPIPARPQPVALIIFTLVVLAVAAAVGLYVFLPTLASSPPPKAPAPVALPKTPPAPVVTSPAAPPAQPSSAPK